MSFIGAGGTEGGAMRFFIGFIMFVAGAYLFLDSIFMESHMGFGSRMFGVGGVGITTGYVLIPFIFGVGMIFYNSKNYLGWILILASLAMLSFGVIVNSSLSFRHLTAFKLIMILILFVGGAGLSLSALRSLR